MNLTAPRAQEARIGRAIGSNGYKVLMIVGSLLLIGAGLLATIGHERRLAILLLSPTLACYLPATWWKRQLSVLPPSGNDLTGRLSYAVLSSLRPGVALQPQSMWAAIKDHWQARFFVNHLLISDAMMAQNMSTDPAELEYALQLATDLAQKYNSPVIDTGFITAGLLLASKSMRQLLVQLKAQETDIEAIAGWIGRNLEEAQKARRNFGGIGRDWAFGFTPLLNRFGQNVSAAITDHGANFGWMTGSDGVKAIETAFDNRASAVVLIGPDGIGKSTSVYALAQRLIEGHTSRRLAYHQIISLNATDITSNARGPGELEQMMLNLANEAAHAGHVILFLDDAQLFLGGGPGTFDGTQILLSIVQAQSVPIILAFAPNDYQRLRAQNQSLASLLTPITLQELPESGVMRVLEDSAVGLENKHNVLVVYEALHEAYRLSGRYEQDE
ncbi:MAG TPA: AAA family ATPase, partial [Verrucomicrobiae bacterium]|nr:AAA family ATPase [Verrucomicrobiae bacterium]